MRERDVSLLQILPLLDDVDVLLPLDMRRTQTCLHVLFVDLNQGFVVDLVLL